MGKTNSRKWYENPLDLSGGSPRSVNNLWITGGVTQRPAPGSAGAERSRFWPQEAEEWAAEFPQLKGEDEVTPKTRWLYVPI